MTVHSEGVGLVLHAAGNVVKSVIVHRPPSVSFRLALFDGVEPSALAAAVAARAGIQPERWFYLTATLKEGDDAVVVPLSGALPDGLHLTLHCYEASPIKDKGEQVPGVDREVSISRAKSPLPPVSKPPSAVPVLQPVALSEAVPPKPSVATTPLMLPAVRVAPAPVPPIVPVQTKFVQGPALAIPPPRTFGSSSSPSPTSCTPQSRVGSSYSVGRRYFGGLMEPLLWPTRGGIASASPRLGAAACFSRWPTGKVRSGQEVADQHAQFAEDTMRMVNAVERFNRMGTALANESTMLAWVRTCLAAIRTAVSYLGIVAITSHWHWSIILAQWGILLLVVVSAMSGVSRYYKVKAVIEQKVTPLNFGRISLRPLSVLVVISSVATTLGMLAQEWKHDN